MPLDGYPTSRWRSMAEQAIFGNMRGMGRLGADTWRVVKDAKGNRIARAWERFPASNWGYLNCDSRRAGAGPRRRRGHRPLRGPPRGAPGVRGPRRHRAGPHRQGPAAKVGDDLAKEGEALLVERQKAFWRSRRPPPGRAQPRVRRPARLGLAHPLRPPLVRAVRLAGAGREALLPGRRGRQEARRQARGHRPLRGPPRGAAQNPEARVAMEQALLDKALAAKVGDDLAKKGKALLVKHQKVFWRTVARLRSGPT